MTKKSRAPERFIVERLVLLVRYVDHGTEGMKPAVDVECPYFQETQMSSSCISGSGSSICGGFQGTTNDGYVQCVMWPTKRLPGQLFALQREDVYTDEELPACITDYAPLPRPRRKTGAAAVHFRGHGAPRPTGLPAGHRARPSGPR